MFHQCSWPGRLSVRFCTNRVVTPIAILPQAGRPRDDLAAGLRSVAFERRAVIVYRLIGDTVEITNIFHGGRDYAALYRRAEPDANG
jgi:plasmid stabilization system protein ParE